MHKIPLFSALVLLILMTLPVPRVWAADSGQKLLLEKSFPTASGERLKVNAYAGNIKINCWQKNEIVIKIYGSSDAVKYLDFDVSSDELGINISATKKAGIENVKNLGLRYEISVPHSYCVKVTGGKNVTIDKESAPVEVSRSY
jgi:hypothetical protein